MFEAITRPEITRQFWGHENQSDWEVGSPWQHVRADETRKLQLVGKVLEASPPWRLVISWASPSESANLQAVSRVTFEIAEYDGMVKLTVIHDQLEAGGSMAGGVSRGWPIILSSMKSFLETGRGLDVFAKPKAA
ncbi:SRPBCC family protein [Hyphomonas sp.]|uniref:SRPBCC family protein n=1 Tax=Hyphomonas sp. TaxID=87 RepID=UPI003918BC7D